MLSVAFSHCYAEGRYAESHIVMLKAVMLRVIMWNRGARKLTGENLKVVWAEFSTLS